MNTEKHTMLEKFEIAFAMLLQFICCPPFMCYIVLTAPGGLGDYIDTTLKSMTSDTDSTKVNNFHDGLDAGTAYDVL